jgi:hypothetical protein
MPGGMTESIMPARPDWWVPPVSSGPEDMASVPRHRPANALAWAAVLLIGLSVALTAAIATVLGTSSLSPYDVALVDGSRWHVAIDLLMLRLLLWVAAPIAWFLWFDRVLRNVEPLTGQRPASSRFGAVAWWFVPIASTWKPARAVGDVYRRVAVPGTPGPWLPAFWWLSWVGSTLVPLVFAIVLGLVAGFRRMPLERVQEGALWLERIGDGLEIVAGVLAIGMIIAIQRAQSARSLAIRGPDAGAGPVGEVAPGWDASGPEAPAPLLLPARPGSLPGRSLFVAGAIIASGLLASAALAHGVIPPSPLAVSGATPTATATLATSAASPSPTPSPAPTRRWTVVDHLRSKVLDRTSGYSARISVDGTLRVGDAAAAAVVRGNLAGTVVVSGRDFIGRERITSVAPEMRSDVSVAVIAGRIWVRQGEGPWSSATPLPEVFAVDPLLDLLRSHDLVELGPGSGRDADLVRIEWPIAAVGLAATMEHYAGASFEPGGVTVAILAEPDGTPVRVEIEIGGTYLEGGDTLDFRTVLTYRYSGVGQPITVEDPDSSE